MPSYLDLGLIVVVLMSALLSMLRGFTREVLAIGSWAAASVAAYLLHPMALPFVKQYVSNEKGALAIAAASIFLMTLVVVSIITVKISDLILDSRIGALDRSLGFLFGAGRGFLLCAIAFVFFAFLVPEKSFPSWVVSSKTRVWLEATGSSLEAMLPENLDQSLSKILKKEPKTGDEPPSETDDKAPAPATAPVSAPVRPGQRSQARPDNTPQSIDAVLNAGSAGSKR
jgi:membrane protein required for colicin V production